MKNMVSKIKDNILFQNISELEIENILMCSGAQVKTYKKNVTIFSQADPPKALYVLLSGSVAVCKDSPEGKRYIVTTIGERDIFGEVYVFLEEKDYSYYALTTSESNILEIPKSFFFHTCQKSCTGHASMIRNMLGILAKKAYYLNNKVQLLTSGNLRQKIAKYILERRHKSIYVKLNMTREQFADFLNVARPSLSRELIKMQKEGLIEVDRDMIRIIDEEKLMSCVKGMDEEIKE